MNNKKGIFITVRSGSTRLPDKALLKINGKHTIEYVIESAKNSTEADIIVLCTTELKQDDALCEIAKKHQINFFRGSVEDKLERWNQAAKKYDVDFFVTADGDDLFCSHELMDLAFRQYELNDSEFIEGDGLACGTFTYGISSAVLQEVCNKKESTDTEMMWVYFTETNVCKVEKLSNVPNCYIRNDVRMTLDYEEDFCFFKTVIENFSGSTFNTRDVLAFLDNNKEVIELNYSMRDRWKQNQIENTTLEYND